MSSQLKICPESVRTLAELLRETDLSEIEYQVDSLRIKVVRIVSSAVVPVAQPAPVTSVPLSSEANSENELNSDYSKNPNAIKAQMVGTVYLAPGPTAANFVDVGSKVEVGQTLFIIEAMKVMNMIKAPKSGTVKQVLVKDSQPVEFDEPIMIIE